MAESKQFIGVSLSKDMVKEAIRQFVLGNLFSPGSRLEVGSVEIPNSLNYEDATVKLALREVLPPIETLNLQDRAFSEAKDSMQHCLKAYGMIDLSDPNHQHIQAGIAALFRLGQRKMRESVLGMSEGAQLPNPVVAWARQLDYGYTNGAGDEWVVFRYKNHRGKVEMRAICRPIVARKVSEFHPAKGECFQLVGFDLDRWSERHFVMDDIQWWGFHLNTQIPAKIIKARDAWIRWNGVPDPGIKPPEPPACVQVRDDEF